MPKGKRPCQQTHILLIMDALHFYDCLDSSHKNFGVKLGQKFYSFDPRLELGKSVRIYKIRLKNKVSLM